MPTNHTQRRSAGIVLIRILGLLLGLYLIGRAVAEPFMIDFGDPRTYHLDWGGPTLLGVLAVHCLPGLIAAGLIGRGITRRRAGVER